jgi:hypothetical protein
LGIKEELVREVTSAIQEHIERKTAESVDNLWQKGQRAMKNLQQQQVNQTQHLQSQLLQCAEAHQELQRENAMLRSGLEALMKHLTLVFGAPAHMHGAPPGMPGCMPPGVPTAPPPCTPTAAGSAASPSPFFPQTPAAAAAKTPQCPPEAATSKSAGEPSLEDFHTPAGSPLRGEKSAAEELGVGPSPTPALNAIPGFPIGSSSSGGTGSDTASSVGASPLAGTGKAPTFSLTLRRADNVPLGLDVIGEKDQDFLLVEGIRLGGAVEAWNRQCHPDSREIRRGDRIVMINESKDAESMREECLKKHLLRMTVSRALAEPGVASSTPAAATGLAGLRADANEFVPQALMPATSATS